MLHNGALYEAIFGELTSDTARHLASATNVTVGCPSAGYAGGWANDGCLFEFGGGMLALATVLCVLFCALAAAGGIGGGGLLTPMYLLAMTASVKYAAPLSKATILGNAIGKFSVIGFDHHPETAAFGGGKYARPRIDYDIAMLMQSGLMLGTSIGVFFNHFLPEIVIKVFLFVVLLMSGLKAKKKAHSTYAKENAKRALERQEEASASASRGFPPSPLSRASPPRSSGLAAA